jgi:hypothetical protein
VRHRSIPLQTVKLLDKHALWARDLRHNQGYIGWCVPRIRESLISEAVLCQVTGTYKAVPWESIVRLRQDMEFAIRSLDD